MMISPIGNPEQAVANMLQRINALEQKSPQAQAGSRIAGQHSFANALKLAIDDVSNAQNQANAQAQSFALGKPDVALSDVMIDMQKASMKFQFAVQVRNKVVAAYQQIASMPI